MWALANKEIDMSVDYFGKYFNEEGWNFTLLLNDDFFEPVKLLFNAKFYVSATKLLVVAIDSVSFIEYGNIKENTFIKWLDTYAEIDTLGITSEELWEHRNSLLHMSNLESKKILSGKVRALIAYIGEQPANVKLNEENIGYYNLSKLIHVFAEACGKWCLTYDSDRTKINSFIKRYDLIISDARLLKIEYNEPQDIANYTL